MTQKLRMRASRLGFAALAAGTGLALSAAVAHHVYQFDFKPLAALGVPVLLAFFGFSSLLYLRSRALAKKREQLRSLYAAERAMQGALWHVTGILAAVAVYAVLMRLGVKFDASAPSIGGLWLLLFLAPYALLQAGLVSFLRAVWIVAPQFFPTVGPRAIRQRVA